MCARRGGTRAGRRPRRLHVRHRHGPRTAFTRTGPSAVQRTTLSSEGIEIRSEDELFAKLPLGALALEGELARSGRLGVKTMVSGQYMLEGFTAADVPDYGECASATHLVSSVSLGSFKLHSGGRLDGGATLAAGEAGGGAHTSSMETLLREAGDFDSCKLSTDDTPELGCSSPVQAFLVPLPRFATAGVGLIAVAPGVYLIASSGSKTEVLSEHGELLQVNAPNPAPGLGVSSSF